MPVNYFPAFLNLSGKKVVVIGGGKVAERKIISLLKADAHVTVVSPALTPVLHTLVSKNRLVHQEKTFDRSDLRGAFLVVSATNSGEVNRRVAAAAPSLVNVVDMPSQCNFISPSVIQRGALTIAISTGGTSPSLAKSIRKELEKAYGSEFSSYLAFIGTVRDKALRSVSDLKQRETFLKFLGSETMLGILRTDGLSEAKKVIRNSFAELAKKRLGKVQ